MLGKHRDEILVVLEVGKVDRNLDDGGLANESARPSQKSSRRRRRTESGRAGSRMSRKAKRRFDLPTLFSPTITAWRSRSIWSS